MNWVRNIVNSESEYPKEWSAVNAHKEARIALINEEFSRSGKTSVALDTDLIEMQPNSYRRALG